MLTPTVLLPRMPSAAVVATTTYYEEDDVIRAKLAYQLLQKAINAHHRPFVVDGTPHPWFRDHLSSQFASVSISKQTDP